MGRDNKIKKYWKFGFLAAVIFCCGFFIIRLNKISNKDKVIYYYSKENKPMINGGGITENFFINYPLYTRMFLLIQKIDSKELSIQTGVNICDTLSQNKYHHDSNLITCDINGCIIFYDVTGNIKRMILLYCESSQIFYKESNVKRHLLLNDDGRGLFLNYFSLKTEEK